jgi:hypothetical protein
MYPECTTGKSMLFEWQLTQIIEQVPDKLETEDTAIW